MENQNQLEAGIREYITQYLRTEVDEAVVKKWLDKLTDPGDPLTVLAEWNTFAECHGVEYVAFPGEQFNEQKGVSYANTGETYALTLLWDHRDRQFCFGDWGSAYEKMEADAIAHYWDKIARREFISALERRFMTDLDTNLGEGDDPLLLVFDAAREKADVHPRVEGDYVLCDVEPIAAAVPIEDIVEMCSKLDNWYWDIGEDETTTPYRHGGGNEGEVETWDAIAAQKVDDDSALVYYRSSGDDAVIATFLYWISETESFWFTNFQEVGVLYQTLFAPLLSPKWEEFDGREEWPWVGYYVVQTTFNQHEET